MQQRRLRRETKDCHGDIAQYPGCRVGDVEKGTWSLPKNPATERLGCFGSFAGGSHGLSSVRAYSGYAGGADRLLLLDVRTA
jgi:hypothetical protein